LDAGVFQDTRIGQIQVSQSNWRLCGRAVNQLWFALFVYVRQLAL
jgi:hypothetical protein